MSLPGYSASTPREWDSAGSTPGVAGANRASAGIPGEWLPDQPAIKFEDSWLHRLWESRVLHSDNDLIVCIAASSRSAGSGVGKSTAALRLARYFDASEDGYDATDKATLDSTEFSKGLLNNAEKVPNRSAIIFDEATGTLSSHGSDKRRAMADSVMNVTKALATLRYRQCTALIVAQSTNWLDSRMRDVIDALILIQRKGHAVIYQPFRNDLRPSNEYNDRKGELTWDALPDDGDGDEDYKHLEKLKRESTKQAVNDEEAEDIELSSEQKQHAARQMRKRGLSNQNIATALDMSESWASKYPKDVEVDDS